jgi:hypothetical protein
MSRKLTVPLTWGELVREPAESCQGGDFPAISYRRVYLPIGYFNRFGEVNEALIKAMPGTHVLPRYTQAPTYLTVFDPPPKKELPIHVEIQEEEETTNSWSAAVRGAYRRWIHRP